MYKSLTVGNKSALKRFSHSKRFELAVNLLDIKRNDSFMDYGTGDGHLLLLIRDKYHLFKRIVGYEPFDSQFSELINTLDNNSILDIEIIKNLPNEKSIFNKISCLEVLEHMTLDNQRKILNNIFSLLTEDGILVLSVPIEIGLSGLMKNLARIFLRQTHAETNFYNLIKSTFCIPIDRGSESYISTHIGFSYKDLEVLFPEIGFKVKKLLFSPIQFFGSTVNSQVFYILVKMSNK